MSGVGLDALTCLRNINLLVREALEARASGETLDAVLVKCRDPLWWQTPALPDDVSAKVLVKCNNPEWWKTPELSPEVLAKVAARRQEIGRVDRKAAEAALSELRDICQRIKDVTSIIRPTREQTEGGEPVFEQTKPGDSTAGIDEEGIAPPTSKSLQSGR